MMNRVCLPEVHGEMMTDLRQQIATQINAYHTLDAVKAAVAEWASAFDGSLDALEKVLTAYCDDELTEDDWQHLQEQGLAFDGDSEAATRGDDSNQKFGQYWTFYVVDT